jgi:hypothetical protein
MVDNLNMPILLDCAALGLLAAIVVELYFLIRMMGKLPLILKNAAEKKNRQTINVNVATSPPQEAKALDVAPRSEKWIAEKAAAIDSSEAREPAPQEAKPAYPSAAYAEPIKAATSGQMVTKCPKCQSENSSIRDECFNCGAKLR